MRAGGTVYRPYRPREPPLRGRLLPVQGTVIKPNPAPTVPDGGGNGRLPPVSGKMHG